MVITIVPALVLLLGGLAFGFAASPKLSEMGRIAFLCGLLALCLALSQHVVRLP